LAHVRTAVSAANLRTEIHATKQNVSFRTYRRQEQTLTESANQGQRKSKMRTAPPAMAVRPFLESPFLRESFL
jgi:hypothetical protein